MTELPPLDAEFDRELKAHIEAGIRRVFHMFLLTYEVCEHREDFSISSEEGNALDEVALERLYGEGKYDDRKERLDYVLDELFAARRVDFGSALAALAEAAGFALASARDTQKLEAFRELHQEGDLVRENLLQWTKRLRSFVLTVAASR